jgi:hypothetical protein
VCQSTILVRREAGGYHVMRAGVHLILLRREPHGWAIVSRVARQLDGGGTAFDLIATGLKGNTQ